MRAALLLLLPVLTYGQTLKQQATEPFKKANVIILRSTLSDVEAFRAAGQTLVSLGMPIENSNADFFTINTGMFSPEDWAFKMKVNISVQDGTVKLRGDSFNAGHRFGVYYAPYKSVPTAAFGIMNKYALALIEKLGGEVEYGLE